MTDFCDLPRLELRTYWPTLENPAPPTDDTVNLQRGYLDASTGILYVRTYAGLLALSLAIPMIPRLLTDARHVIENSQIVCSTFVVDTDGLLTIEGLVTCTFGRSTIQNTGQIVVQGSGRMVTAE